MNFDESGTLGGDGEFFCNSSNNVMEVDPSWTHFTLHTALPIYRIKL